MRLCWITTLPGLEKPARCVRPAESAQGDKNLKQYTRFFIIGKVRDTTCDQRVTLPHSDLILNEHRVSQIRDGAHSLGLDTWIGIGLREAEEDIDRPVTAAVRNDPDRVQSAQCRQRQVLHRTLKIPQKVLRACLHS